MNLKPLQFKLSILSAATLLLVATPLIAKNPTHRTTIAQDSASENLQTQSVNLTITEAEVLNAQKAWGDALVAISTAHDEQGAASAKALAEKVIDEAYGYQYGAVLFKPTLTTAPHTFRTTRAGALSYFVGGDSNFPGDTGFALKGWRKVEIKNAGVFITGNVATTMGKVSITDKTGKVTTVDKTWEFVKDGSGKLRIVVHHSSLPYTPQ